MAQVGWTPRPRANTNTPKPRMRLAGAKFSSSLCGYHLSKRERERERRGKAGRMLGSGGGPGASRLVLPHDFPGSFQSVAPTHAHESHVIAYLRKHSRNVVCVSHPLSSPPDCGLHGHPLHPPHLHRRAKGGWLARDGWTPLPSQ